MNGFIGLHQKLNHRMLTTLAAYAGVTPARVAAWAYGTKKLRGTAETDLNRAYADLLRGPDDPRVMARWLAVLRAACLDFKESATHTEKPGSTV